MLSPHTGSLKDRHIQNGAVIYAIFTPKENLKQAPQIPKREFGETDGGNVVRCHIMLKVRLNYSILVMMQLMTILTDNSIWILFSNLVYV